MFLFFACDSLCVAIIIISRTVYPLQPLTLLHPLSSTSHPVIISSLHHHHHPLPPPHLSTPGHHITSLYLSHILPTTLSHVSPDPCLMYLSLPSLSAISHLLVLLLHHPPPSLSSFGVCTVSHSYPFPSTSILSYISSLHCKK